MTKHMGCHAKRKRVLVCVSNLNDAAVIQNLLSTHQATCLLCASSKDFTQRAITEADAILISETMLDSAGLDLLIETLHLQPDWSDLPVLLISREGAESTVVYRAMHSLTNVLLLKQPIQLISLDSALKMTLRGRKRQHHVRKLLKQLIKQEHVLQEMNETLDLRVKRRTEKIEAQYKELKELSARIQKLSHRTIQAMENDRRALSKEIHDSIGGSLAAVKIILETKLAKLPSESIDSMQIIVTHLIDTIKESKRISYQLRPRVLDEFGLVPALIEHFKKFNEFFPKIKVDSHIRVSPNDIPDATKTAVYRVVQEAMTNIGKHSRADHAQIELTESDSQIFLMIQDNGVGFNVSATVDTSQSLQGYGMISMKERVEICGGTFDIESSVGTGTRLSASFTKTTPKYETQ